MAGTERLMFTVSLVDKITTPLKGVRNALSDVTTRARRGFHDMQMGAIGLAATGFAVAAALAPARDMYRALGEVRSLGVADEALNQLQTTALNFSTQYGESATDFVRASYDIQSAIGGLSGQELAAFTNASAILAKGTKSDVGTITSYLGTMYGVYKDTAAEMGKSEWVNVVAGQTAAAVQMFKTTGAEMSAAASRVGADAASLGITMHEQMAVLGTLQSTMSGSEAGTRYRAFLKGVAKAQGSLGLNFTDANGQLLPMIDILEKIRGKYGETLDVAESAELTKAFGTAEASALIKLLINNTDGLNASIEKLGNISGIDQAAQMAAAMIHPFDQAGQSVKAIATSFGMILLPVLQPILTGFADMLGGLVNLTQEYPNVTRYIAIAVLAIAAASASMALLTLSMGFARTASAAWLLVQKTLTGVIVLFKGAMLAVNAVLLVNPIGLMVTALTALVAGIAAVIYWWDDLKSAFTNNAWVQAITGFLSSVVTGIKNMLAGVINWFIDKVNIIPGVNIDRITTQTNTPPIEALEKTRTPTSVPGGVTQQISNAVNSSRSDSASIENLTINTNQPVNTIKNELAMLGG